MSFLPTFFKTGLQKIGVVAADEEIIIKICGVCYETGSLVRKCCNKQFCDHCYTKNKACPGCFQPTRQEKMTGATYMLPVFSEHEECRRCLDPGLQRRCCGNYYCDECYYSAPNCRSCEKPITKKGLNAQLSNGRGTLFTVISGYCLTILLVLAVIGGVAIITLNELTTPIGISGYSCHGFFTPCDLWVCAGVDRNVSYGDAPLSPLYDWRACNLNSEIKLQSWGCVFDSNLYAESNHILGYDVCIDKFIPGPKNYSLALHAIFTYNFEFDL